jgi:hypothetical protein
VYAHLLDCNRCCRADRVLRRPANRGSAPTDPTKLKLAQQAMREVIQFRQDPRNQFVSDYISNAMVEKNQIVNIEALFGGKERSKESVLKDDAN